MTTPVDPPADVETASSSASSEPASPTVGLEAEVVSALQAALAADHAAVWVYGLLIARMPADLQPALGAALAAHRATRDATERTLSDADIDPVPAEPAYQLPEALNDRAAGVRLAVTTEQDSTNAWYAVLAFTDTGDELRRSALAALVAASVRAARWRVEAGTTPVTAPFPGQPTG